MKEQKIKQENNNIGLNIRRIRKDKGLGQTQIVAMLQLQGVEITRESLVKIERGIQHITVSQLKGLKDVLNVSYDEILM